MDALYGLDNVLTVRITLPPAEWDAIRSEQPKGGVCNFDWTGGARFTWRKATSVEISGGIFPARTSFAGVGVKKKSFCGSLNSDKPCLHIDFGKFGDSTAVQELIGTRYLTLNNSIQDGSYVRQTLGYRLFEMAGLPFSRSNYARVFVNGTLIGADRPGVNSPGVFVSVEPIMRRYIERNFHGNLNGNLYELEHNDDLIADRLRYVGVESLSAFEDRADLRLAADRIAAAGVAGLAQVVDLDRFIQLYAMEFFLKHWDGYSRNTNNSYLYNDVPAVASPAVGDVRLTMIPWGLDQILQPERSFKLGDSGVVARLVRNDPARRAVLAEQIRVYRHTVFGRENRQTVLQPLLDRMRTVLAGLGVPNLAAEIATVRRQLRLAASAGYLYAGLPTDGVYLADERDRYLHASTTETLPPDTPTATDFEVYHRALDESDSTDRWTLAALGTGTSLTDPAGGRVLHASNTQLTAQGNKLLYTCPPRNVDHAEEFLIAPSGAADPFTYNGYFRLTSVRTGAQVSYGTDPTPGGRPRVYQEPIGTKLYFC